MPGGNHLNIKTFYREAEGLKDTLTGVMGHRKRVRSGELQVRSTGREGCITHTSSGPASVICFALFSEREGSRGRIEWVS